MTNPQIFLDLLNEVFEFFNCRADPFFSRLFFSDSGDLNLGLYEFEANALPLSYNSQHILVCFETESS